MYISTARKTGVLWACVLLFILFSGFVFDVKCCNTSYCLGIVMNAAARTRKKILEHQLIWLGGEQIE